MDKVIVGLSGGVDSSVTALQLQRQGFTVEALFMKNWDEDDGSEYCTARTDLEDAMRVCDQLDIPLHTVNFAKQYWDNVFAHFLREYRAGRTPNPDVLCNREIKFKVFIEHAEKLGANKIATGHYARTEHGNDGTRLLKALDSDKDQSYFLHAVAQYQLAKTHFPIGEIDKATVRKIAKIAGLNTHDKKDSTGICFIGERRFKDFLQRYLPAQPGPICDESGHIIGQHQGLMYHTIGQRQGLGIGGMTDKLKSPWYVAEKDLTSNTLVVVQGNKHSQLFSRSLLADEMHWINGPPALPLSCTAKTRYRQTDQNCLISATDSGVRAVFDQPQRAVTTGQYIVLYQGDHCLGGGVITAAGD